MTIMTRGGAKTWWGIDLPKNVVGLTKEHPFDDWKPVLYQDVVKRKIEKQNANIRLKKWDPYAAKRKPCFIWVFYNDPKKNPFYSGWWMYVKTFKKDYPLNFRYPNKELVNKVMNLYPCGFLPMESIFERWAEAFARQYHHEGFGRTKQGLVKAWCKIREDEIIDVIPL